MIGTDPSLPPIRACIFDMDGLLIDSEDIYTDVTNQILRKYGRPELPWSIKAQLQGKPNPVASKIFSEWAQLPISHETYLSEQSALQAKLFPTTQPLPGVLDLLSHLRDTYHIEIALATSSMKRNYELKSAHLPALFVEYFPAAADTPSPLTGKPLAKVAQVLGDDPRVPKGRGKPRGDIYLLALKLLNEDWRARGEGAGEGDILPEECLVFEDSVPGVEAGRRAGMRVVWCPHPSLAVEFKGREGEVLAGRSGDSGLEDEAEEARERGLRGWPSREGDGWAGQLESLVDFPYEKFGIMRR